MLRWGNNFDSYITFSPLLRKNYVMHFFFNRLVCIHFYLRNTIHISQVFLTTGYFKLHILVCHYQCTYVVFQLHFINNSRLYGNHCFITNYSKLLLLLHVHVFPYNLDYLKYIFYRFNVSLCLLCQILMVVMLSICLQEIQRILLPWYSWLHYALILTKRENGLDIVVLKDVPDVMSIKAFITLKTFFSLLSWGVINKMWLYIKNVILIYCINIIFFFQTRNFVDFLGQILSI